MSLPVLSPKIARFPARFPLASLLSALLFWQGIFPFVDPGRWFPDYCALRADTASSLIALFRHAPAINGRVEGTVQQLIGENVTLNSGAVITGDLRVPGSPTVQINGSANYGGTQFGNGSASPSGYKVTLNTGATLGHVVTRTDPVALDAVAVPPAAAGTRDLAVNAVGQSLGDFLTLRDLTLNSNVGLFNIPSGTYRRLVANGQSGFIFGLAGSSQPSIYNLEELTLNSNSHLQVAGPVVINLANRMTVNSGVTVGAPANANWISLNVARYGVTINTNSVVYGNVRAPAGTVLLNGRLEGSCASDRLTINSGAILKAGVSNQAPRVDAGPDQTIIFPNTVTLNGNVSDDGLPAGGGLTTSWSKVSGPGEVSFANPSTPSTTATLSVQGDYVLRLTATDSVLSSSDDVAVTVHAANQAPVVSAGANQTITLPSSANLQGTVRDDGLPEGSSLTIQWSKVSGPGTVTFADVSQPTTMASFSESGTYVLQLSASDSVLSSSSQLTITANPPVPVNQAPVVSAGTDQTISLPASATLHGSATDDGLPSGSTLALAWSPVSGPGAVMFGNPSLAVTTASFSAPGSYVLRLTASDSLLTSQSEISITVNPENQAPVVNAGPDQSVTLTASAILNGSASDDGWPQGAVLTVTWSVFNGPGEVTFSNSNQVDATATFSRPGDYVLRLTASDTQLSTSDEVTITVYPSNQAPVVNAGPDLSIALPGTATLNGTATDDGKPDGSTLVLSWSMVSGPGTVTFSSPTMAVTTATFSMAGQYALRLTATDSDLTASDDVAVTVVFPLNLPPRVSAGPDQVITFPSSATLDGTASDDGLPGCSPPSEGGGASGAGGCLTFTWSQVSGPGAVSFSNPNALSTTASFTKVGTYVLQLEATDSVLSSSSHMTIVVNAPNQAPVVNAGPDQTITLPASAALAGTASDDGLPACDPPSEAGGAAGTGGCLTFTWSQVSGPGIATFSDVNAAATTVSFSAPGTYLLRLTADDSSLAPSDDVVVVVNPSGPPLPPDPSTVAPPLNRTTATTMAAATEFLYTGDNPIQTGVAAGTINPQRVAVLRGRVVGPEGEPLPAVKITILNHPEFGQTLSRADGMFDIAVNGGGQLVIIYEKEGLLPIQRQTKAPWQDYAWLPEVVMIPLDAQVSTISLNAGGMQIHQGSLITDSDGSRRAIILFPGATTANLELPDGTSQPVNTLHVRATEYTVGPNGPAAMPADLPPQTVYTYAVEYTANEALAAGAVSVKFSQPVIHYMENFLGLKPGQTVPSGYYDRQKGAWVPSDNGLVVHILALVEGQVVLDLDGSGQAAMPDAYAAKGITGAERQQLAALYQPGQSLWRIPISHFSTWDFNFGFPISPGQVPNQPEAKSKDQKQENPDCRPGSIVECQNQVLGEAVSILGTPFNLHYRSDQVSGRRVAFQLDIPLTGATLPQGLQQVQLVVKIAGQELRWEFAPEPNLRYTFTWNGEDAYGRLLNGSQKAQISIGYVYRPDYTGSYRFALTTGFRIVGIGGGGGGPVILVRRPIIAWQDYEVNLGLLDSKPLGLAGWRLSHQHVYDPVSRMLLEGDGQQRGTQTVADIISTVAGGGANSGWYAVPGGVPGQTASFSPKYLAAAPDGSTYISDGNLLARLYPNGILTRVPGFNGEIRGVAVDELGRVFISSSSQVQRLDPNGTITVVAGVGGSPGFSGDNGPAIGAQINISTGLALAPDGTFYIAGGSRIRKISPGGIINTIAGDGVAAYSGDNGSALAARVNSPAVPTIASDGTLYFTDYNPAGYGSYLIRKITPGGIINTLATTNIVDAMAAAADGSLYFSEFNLSFSINGYFYYSGLSQLLPDGTKRSIVPWEAYINPNTGQTLPINDGASPGRAVVYRLEGLTVASGGDVYLSHTGRIRQIRAPMPELHSGENLISSQDGSEVYIFDSSGKHLRTIDALTGGLHYRFEYDSTGLLISVTDGDNNVTTIQRAGPVPQAILGPYGQTTRLGVDGNGYLNAVTNPASETVSFSYNAGGLLAAMTDARQHVYQFQFDADGRLTRDEDPVGGFLDLARSETSAQYQISLSTPLSNPTNYQVESLAGGGSRRTNTLPDGTHSVATFSIHGTESATSPDGTTSSLVQQPDPRWGMQAPLVNSLVTTTPAGLSATLTGTSTASLSQLSDPLSLTTQTSTLAINGRTYTSVYTASNRTFTNTSPVGRQSNSTIDLLGRVVRSQMAGLEPVNFGYDSRGRLQTISQGTGSANRTVNFGYSASGYLETVTDPLLREASFEYDQAGRVKTQTLPGNRLINFNYDANGNLTSLTPPGKPQHGFDYTAVDLMSQYDPPVAANVGTRFTTYAYDTERKPALITRPDGQTIDFDYDTAGRLKTSNLPGRQLTYNYSTTTGKLTNIIDPTGSSLAYTYDGSLPKSTTWSGTVNGSISRNYDNNFRVTSRSINGSNTVSFGYDSDSLLTQAGSLTLARNPQNGLLTGTTLGSVTDSWSYNSFAEPINYTASVGGMQVYSTTFTRDNLGRITSKTEMIQGATDTTVYGYDTAGRLETVARNGSLISTYTYDANGNRLSAQRITNPEPQNTYTYDDQDRLLTTNVGHGNPCYFSYSANGELQTKTCGSETTTYSYDVLGNLRHVAIPDGTQIDYVIDAQNRRVGKKVNGTLVQGWLYGNQLNPVAELDGSGNVAAVFVYGSRANVPDYMMKGGVTYRIISDHLGSPRMVINTASGVILQRIDYDEFGNVTNDTNPGLQPFGFAGGLYDQPSRLIHFGARDYDPEIGRWTAKDPVFFNGGDFNLYGYIVNDPVNHVDPVGLWSPAAHDTMIEHAFHGMAPVILNALMRASSDFDKETQSLSQSYMHSMRQPGQASAEAERLKWNFVAASLMRARCLAKQGNRDEALRSLGEALHPIMDSLSPIHTDKNGNPRVWRPWWPAGHSPTEAIGGETVIQLTPEILDRSDQLLQSAFQEVFGY